MTNDDTKNYAAGGVVSNENGGMFMLPGETVCPLPPGNLDTFEHDFLEAMNQPIADPYDGQQLGCFTIRVPQDIDLEQLASRVSRDVSSKPRFAVMHEVEGEEADMMMKRVHEILDRKQAERDNIND